LVLPQKGAKNQTLKASAFALLRRDKENKKPSRQSAARA
jgi:hypothetical protein